MPISLWSQANKKHGLDHTYSGYIDTHEVFLILEVAEYLLDVPGFVQAKVLTSKGVFLIDGHDLKTTRLLKA